MGRLNESAEYLIKVCRAGDQRYVLEAEELLSEIVEQIDLLREQKEDSQQFMKNCTTIARYCEATALSTYGLMPISTARLYLAEISLLAANEDHESLSEANRLLDVLAREGLRDNVDYLRCRARLLTKQGKFDKAAELWAKIAEIRRGDPAPPHQRSWKWWRAKFYELHCWSRRPQTDKESLLHTIEVLENSFSDIPPFWAEKLSSLRLHCRNQLINAGY
jgi:tetratricopeptide (TPR) repeat protein